MGKLGQLLVARGWITVQQLTRALKNQSVVGGRLGTCLLEMDALSEETLLKALAEQLGVPSAGPDDLRGVPTEVLELIPEKLARRCRAVPFQVMGSRVDVAMMDPRNISCQDELAFASGKRIKVHIAHELRLFEALERYYREEMPSRLTLLLDRLNRARYMWEKPAAEPDLASAAPVRRLDDLYVTTPSLAPALPGPSLPPSARAARPVTAPLRPATPAAAAAPAAPAAESVPAPAPRVIPRSLTLTAEERAELGFLKEEPPPSLPPPAPPAPEAPPRPKPSSTTLEEVESAFATANEREEVAEILVAFLARSYRRVALFQAGKDKVSGWLAQGEGIERKVFEQFSVGFDQPSLFLNLRQGAGLHMGPMPPMPAHRALARAWGGELPKDCVMLPIRMKDRLVAVLYADGGRKGVAGVGLPQLQRLTAATAAAFERCILHKKRGASKS
ncbi:MAG TPA: hypothetical protein VEL74_24750 [Thermoanaerobaculia bacterium]|nr:hypothetical protein [Thermoanaerobaculia bacterium]